MNKKILIVGHHDLDGFGSIALVERFEKGIKNEVVIKYDSNPDKSRTTELINEAILENGSKNFDAIYVLDRQYPDVEFDMVFFIDHHKGTKNENAFVCIHNENHSAAKLVADLMFPDDEIKLDFGNTVSLWDTFQWKKADRESAERALRLNTLKLQYEDYNAFKAEVVDIYNFNVDKFLEDKNELYLSLKAEEESYINSEIEKIKIIDFRGNKVGFFVYEKLISQIADKFLTDNKEIDMIIAYNKEYNSISMRSKLTDVSVIAKEFNGGGHSGAAGCSCTGEFENLVKHHTAL